MADAPRPVPEAITIPPRQASAPGAPAARAAEAPRESIDGRADELRRKKRELATLVVHDLRSPLSALQGYLTLLRDDVGPEAASRAQRAFEDCDILVAKVLSLVATILDVEELEDGILKVTLRTTRFEDIVRRVAAGHRVGLETRGVTLEVLAPAGLELELDAELCTRVIENLVDNALRYAPRGGHIVLSAEWQGDVIEIGVGNTGPSVPPESREAIFGRHYQIEQRRVFARANRGLGLYFCKLAAEAHGGHIRVEERGALGAVFVVAIPQAAEIK